MNLFVNIYFYRYISKLLEYANLTMRYFLLDRQNFEATKSIHSKIPQDALNIILSQYNFSATGTTIESNFQQIIENLPVNVTNTIKEYLCSKEYIVISKMIFSYKIKDYRLFFSFCRKQRSIYLC